MFSGFMFSGLNTMILFFIGCVWAIYLMSLFNIQMSEPEALKTIEEKDVNESGISNSLQRSVYENQNKVVNESVILKNIKYFE